MSSSIIRLSCMTSVFFTNIIHRQDIQGYIITCTISLSGINFHICTVCLECFRLFSFCVLTACTSTLDQFIAARTCTTPPRQSPATKGSGGTWGQPSARHFPPVMYNQCPRAVNNSLRAGVRSGGVRIDMLHSIVYTGGLVPPSPREPRCSASCQALWDFWLCCSFLSDYWGLSLFLSFFSI